MSDPSESIPDHPVFGQINSKCTALPETQCAGCAVAALHPSIRSYRVTEAATVNERINVADIIRVQWGLLRRQIDCEGIVAASGHPWYPYYGAGAVNFVYGTGWEIAAIDGDEITLIAPDGNPREITQYSFTMPSPDDPMETMNGGVRRTALQPGDLLKFSDNSVMSRTAIGVVVQILGVGTESGLSADQIKVKLDKAVDGALTLLDGESGDVTCTTYQYGANQYNWQFIRDAVWFFGRKVELTVTAGDVPTDGIYTLSDTMPVMHPGGLVALKPTWVFEGQRIDDSTWETVPQANDRLFTLPDSGKVCFKTDKPADSVDSVTLADDLTVTYSQFRFVYYVRTDGTGRCEAVGHPCKHAWRDTTNSVGNVWGLTAGQALHGVGVDTAGRHWYCGVGRRDVDTYTDEYDAVAEAPGTDGVRDTIVSTSTVASGRENFPASGFCTQHGMCDQHTAAENDTGRDAFFRVEYHYARAQGEIVGAADAKAVQAGVGSTDYIASRILHPSLAWHKGYCKLLGPPGIHEDTKFSNYGAWGTPRVVDDGAGGEALVTVLGENEEFDSSDPTAGGQGLWAAEVTDFTDTRDPLARATVMASDELERIGYAIERDTGASNNNGLSVSSVAIAAQNILLPNLDFTLMDEWQTRTMGRFMRVTGGPSIVEIFPLRQEDKAETLLGSRVVKSVASAGTDLYTVTLKNEDVKWHIVNDGGELGDSYDQILTCKGGGRWPIAPTRGQEIVSYYDTPKYAGNRLHGAWRGDGIGAGDFRAVITGVSPHGGASAGTWDGDTPDDYLAVNENYLSYGQNQDTVTVWDPTGTVAEWTEDQTVDFYKSSVVLLPGAVLRYTAYGTDSWVSVVPDVVSLHARGRFEIPDAWFDGKANGCFQIYNAILMDHLGIPPASLWNKIRGVLDSTDTAACNFSGGFGTWSFNKYYQQEHTSTGGGGYSSGPVNESTVVGGSGGYFLIGSGPAEYIPPAPAPTALCEVGFRTDLSAIGIPIPIQTMPDGSTIIECKAEISATDVTRTVTYFLAGSYPCSGMGRDPVSTVDTTLVNINYAVVGISQDGDSFTVLGSVPSSTNQAVVDLTAVAQAMLADRSNPQFKGYGTLILPDEVVASDLESMLPEAPLIESLPVCDGGIDTPATGFTETKSTVLNWGSISIGNAYIKYTLPNDDKVRMIPLKRWPSFSA